MKEEEGSLIPSLEGLEASVEEDKTVGAASELRKPSSGENCLAVTN